MGNNQWKLQGALRFGNLSGDPSPASAGLSYFSSSVNKLRLYNGSAWVSLANLSELASTTDGSAGADLIGGENKSYTYITGLTTYTVQDFLDRIDVALGASGGSVFSDAVFRIQDDGDATKQIAFQAASIATGTTRIITMPNSDVNLGLVLTAIQRDGSVAFTSNQPMAGFKFTGLGAGSTAGDSVRYEQAILTSGANAFAANQSMGGFQLTNLAAGSAAADATRKDQQILRDGSQAWTADQSVGGFKLTNLNDPTSAQDAATKAYVDNLSNGIKWKASVRAASVSDIDLSVAADPNPVDGITLDNNDRVLLRAQTDATENGIYSAVDATDPTTWVRTADADSAAELEAAACFAEEGTTWADIAFVQTADDVILGTTNLSFTPFSSNYLTGHDMISLVGGQISVDLASNAGLVSTNPGSAAGQLQVNDDNTTLERNSNTLRVKDNGISDAKLRDSAALSVIGRSANSSGDPADIVAGTDNFVLRRSGTTLGFGLLVNANIDAAAAITYSKLNLTDSIVNADINSAAAIAYSKLNLTGSIVNADINAAAAITYSKLNLSNSIVNADIATGAAIAYSKLNLTNSIVNADIATGAAIDAAKIADGSVSNAEFQRLDGVTSNIQTQLDAKVTGPGSATDEAIARYDGTTGKLVQNSSSNLSDSGALTIADVFKRGDGGLTNFIEEEYIHNQSLTASTTAVLAALTFDSKVYKAIHVEYQVRNGNNRRTGKLYVVCDNADAVAAANVSIVDNSTETAEINLSWSAALNGDNVEISYTTSSGTYSINMDSKKFKA